MALRARKTEINPPRLKALLFAREGTGKTHFCCSFPDTYYIDTEGLQDYPHFCNMVRKNDGDMVYLTELEEIIKEVRELLSTKHNYKTLIIDSISFPYAWLCQLEAERLAKKSVSSEGTEYGANLAKAKRLTFQLGILLSRLDMNVLVTAHEKVKYEKDKEIGKTYDVTDKMAYSLGAVWNLLLMGDKHKLFIRKSRYPEMETNAAYEFNNGYELIKSIFGESIFKRQSEVKVLATLEQITRIKHMITVLNLSEETVNKMLTKEQATTLEDIESDKIENLIVRMQNSIKGEE